MKVCHGLIHKHGILREAVGLASRQRQPAVVHSVYGRTYVHPLWIHNSVNRAAESPTHHPWHTFLERCYAPTSTTYQSLVMSKILARKYFYTLMILNYTNYENLQSVIYLIKNWSDDVDDVDVEKSRVQAYASMPASYIANYIYF